MTTIEPTVRWSTFVAGVPAPQGSKRHVGRGILVESSAAVKPWRESVRWSVLAAQPTRTEAAVTVLLEFVMPRPKSTPKRRTPAATRKPDLDKLTRAVLDAISSAGAWGDDSQVVHLRASKRLAEIGETPGCHITVDAIEDDS